MPPSFADGIGKLTFYEPDRKTFPLLALAETAARRGGLVPCALNAANEEAVSLFLQKKIRFTDIFEIVASYVNSVPDNPRPTLSEIEQTNEAVRENIRRSF